MHLHASTIHSICIWDSYLDGEMLNALNAHTFLGK